MTTTTTTPLAESDQEHHARERLWALIKDIRFAMFTVHHENGHLHSRPMTTQNANVDEDDSLWFFMSKGSESVADLRRDPEVNLAYVDVGADSYVSVSGRALVVDDVARKRLLWSKLSAAWFPGGPEDPDLALVRVAITHADYWDVQENKLTQLFKMAKAAVTGQPAARMGEHAEVRMR